MRRTKEEAEQTRNDILKASLKVFEAKTYDKATLNDIAKEAGVTRGAIYWHFKNKLDIFMALAQEFMRRVFEGIKSEVDHEDLDSLTKIRKIFERFFSAVIGDEEWRCFSVIIEFKMSQSKEVKEITELFVSLVTDYKLFLTGIIEEGKKAGEIRNDIDTDFLAVSFINWSIGFERLYLMHEELYDLKEKKELALENILKIVKA